MRGSWAPRAKARPGGETLQRFGLVLHSGKGLFKLIGLMDPRVSAGFLVREPVARWNSSKALSEASGGKATLEKIQLDPSDSPYSRASYRGARARLGKQHLMGALQLAPKRTSILRRQIVCGASGHL